MVRVLVSACLLGEPVRYNGLSATLRHPVLTRWIEEGRVVPFCPETAGGLPVPRPPSERTRLGVVTAAGRDVTAAFLRGAEMALAEARRRGVLIAVLKDGSPSCGSGSVHDGTFSGKRIPGRGVTADLLIASGVEVFGEDDLEAARARLEELERGRIAGRIP